MKDEVAGLRAEVERLKNECFCLSNERDAYKDVLDTAVSEARKEFAEMLKKDIGKAVLESVKTRGRSGFFFAKDVPYHIDYLLTELTER